MTKKNVMVVLGTRPEAVKMAPLVQGLRAAGGEFQSRVVVTAQHREMLDQVLDLFDIRPDHDLNLMRPGQTLTEVSVRALSKLEPVIRKEKPDLVLVHGDTSTALFAALAAFYQRVPVGHVEAGLRSWDLANPFPEEMNRKFIDGLSTLHFAPTLESKRNLQQEGLSAERIFVTGNTGIDALKLGLRRLATRPPALSAACRIKTQNPFVLVTAHRRENFGRPLEEIFQAIGQVARARPGVTFFYPVHPNPNVRRPAKRIFRNRTNVCLAKPLDYGSMIDLLQRCLFVLTDSGGLQEEAPSLGKPVLVLREVTERPEALRAGTARLVGTHQQQVRFWIEKLLDDSALYRRMARAVNPYGDGQAVPRILAGLRFWWNPQSSRPQDFVAQKRGSVVQKQFTGEVA